MRAAVMFCGAGGSTRGIEDAGYETIGFDHWQPAVDTHRANGFETHNVDLLAETAYSWWRFGERFPVDLLWASPPCQPFSAAGSHQGQYDPRDGFPAVLEALRGLRPRLLAIENVRGITFKKHAPYLASILADIRAEGYTADYRVLNCADFGVPQTRQRTIIVARRGYIAPSWPKPTHAKGGTDGRLPWVTMAEALGWGLTEKPALTITAGGTDTGGADPLLTGGSTARAAYARAVDEGVFLRPGKSMNRRLYAIDEPAPVVAFGHDAASWAWMRPATSLSCDPRVFQPGHHGPSEQAANAIRIEPHEAAALQGFPPDFIFTGGRTAQFKQIGNAVPPKLAEVVVRANMPVAAEQAA